MQVTERTGQRLVLAQQANEPRWIAMLGAGFFLAAAILFYVNGGSGGRPFVFVFGACFVFFAVFAFLRPARTKVIFDKTEGVMVLTVPRGSGRRVTTVPLTEIGGIDLKDMGGPATGQYQQVELSMTTGSGKAPLRLPSTFTGASPDMIYAIIVSWAVETGAFPTRALSE